MIPDLVVVTVVFHVYETPVILSAAKDDKGKEFSERVQGGFREISGRIQGGFREIQRDSERFREIQRDSERLQGGFREGGVR